MRPAVERGRGGYLLDSRGYLLDELGTKHRRNIVSTAHPIHSSLLLPYRAGNVTSISLEFVHANPSCGSELFAGGPLWGTNLCGPRPLPSARGKRAQIARLHD